MVAVGAMVPPLSCYRLEMNATVEMPLLRTLPPSEPADWLQTP
jgi:hypothetical protein